MTVTHDMNHRSATPSGATALALEDRFEVLKEIGDGSFGSVALARVRTAGANVARRGTVVSTMLGHIYGTLLIILTPRLPSKP
jgi:meiosis induction protein kinase IME2/SME1